MSIFENEKTRTLNTPSNGKSLKKKVKPEKKCMYTLLGRKVSNFDNSSLPEQMKGKEIFPHCVHRKRFLLSKT